MIWIKNEPRRGPNSRSLPARPNSARWELLGQTPVRPPALNSIHNCQALCRGWGCELKRAKPRRGPVWPRVCATRAKGGVDSLSDRQRDLTGSGLGQEPGLGPGLASEPAGRSAVQRRLLLLLLLVRPGW